MLSGHLGHLRLPTSHGEAGAVLDKHNRRIKLFGLRAGDIPADCVPEIVRACRRDGCLFSKITVYALPGDSQRWRGMGFRNEGTICGFFPAHIDAEIWAAYPKAERSVEHWKQESESTLTIARHKETSPARLENGYHCRRCKPPDAGEITRLMLGTFREYPCEITPESVARNISDGRNLFRAVFDAQGEMVAIASAEVDRVHSAAELTDCVVAPQHRHRGLMRFILSRLETDTVLRLGIEDLYSLARSRETGMNCDLSMLSFEHTGRLVNNCRMPLGWESMNIWCKRVRRPDAPPRTD